ncbi:MAG: hypothetical protein R2744_01595 [Bacteroidales bacterium]
MKHVLVLINQLTDSASADERDVLDQAEVVERTLSLMGYRVSRASMGADLEKTRRDILSSGADIVFNLVESVDNRADLTHIPPTLLSEMGIPFTGSGPEAMYLTSNKPEAKKLMRQKRIKTPEWYSADESWRANGNGVYIIKPLYEDASVGIDDNSIFRGYEPVRVVEYGLRYGDSFFCGGIH